jgi:hypothetical protein
MGSRTESALPIPSLHSLALVMAPLNYFLQICRFPTLPDVALYMGKHCPIRIIAERAPFSHGDAVIIGSG